MFYALLAARAVGSRPHRCHRGRRWPPVRTEGASHGLPEKRPCLRRLKRKERQ